MEEQIQAARTGYQAPALRIVKGGALNIKRTGGSCREEVNRGESVSHPGGLSVLLIAVLAFIHHKSQQAFHDLQALTAVPSAEQVVVVEVVVQQVQPPTLVEVFLNL